MNFQLFNLQHYFNKKNNNTKLSEFPTEKVAFINGGLDNNVSNYNNPFANYEHLIYNHYQIIINKNRIKYDKSVLANNLKITKKAYEKELNILDEYKSVVLAYRKNGIINNKSSLDQFIKEAKQKMIKRQIVICLDSSFYTFTTFKIFKIIKKIREILTTIDLKENSIAIISYGAQPEVISNFSQNKTKLLFKLSFLLPNGGLTLFIDNYKHTKDSDYSLSKGLEAARNLFFNSHLKDQSIDRVIVLATDKNISGVDGDNSDYFNINKEVRQEEEVNNVSLIIKDLVNDQIKTEYLDWNSQGGDNIEELQNNLFSIKNYEKDNSNLTKMHSIDEPLSSTIKKEEIMTLNLYFNRFTLN